MVKRKANVSIDDWLEEGASLPRTSPATIATVEERPVPADTPVHVSTPVPVSPPATTPTPANEVMAGSVPVEPVAATGDDVDVNHEEAAEWFWTLLAQSGYERW